MFDQQYSDFLSHRITALQRSIAATMVDQRDIKNVVVLGANGSIGSIIVSALLSHPAGFNVSIVTRDKSKIATTFPAAVKVFESDYSTETLREAFQGQDAVVSTLAVQMVPKQKDLIDLAIECGVARFIPSEFGVDTAHPHLKKYLPLAATKTEIVEYLKTKEDRITWTAVITGSFFDWSLQRSGGAGMEIPKRQATIWDGGDTEYEATNLARIGEAVAAVLAPEFQKLTANQYVYVNSFTLTQNKVLRALEQATGEKFAVTESTVSELADSALARLKHNRGDGAAITDLIRATSHGRGGVNNYSRDQPGGLWNERLGLKAENLADTITREVQRGNGDS